jgi:diapolycopene oxygenase
MHGGVKRFRKTRHMQDIFDYFIKYVGSSAYHSPAFMNSLPTIQFRYDLWYVDGGLYNIALGLQRLMDELGIVVRLNSEVAEVCREGARVTGLVTKDGVCHPADIIVSNMEVIPAYEKLLREDKAFMRTLEKYAFV